VEQRFYDDLPIAEIARRQGIDVPLAKYRIRHALELLRRKLEAAGVTEQDL
jgi:DNA-directed RNA polymerase specialized sigma24 family protein